MRIECAHAKIVPLSELKPHPSNRNKHSEKQIQALAKIIARNGQRSPIVVSNLSGFINKGHGRFEAIKLLGWEKCAVDYQDYKDEVEELRDRIADNEIARYSEFDQDGFLEDIDKLDLDTNDLDFEEFGKLDFNINLDNKNNIIDQLEPNKEWEGMPEFEQNDKTSFRHIIVHFKDDNSAKEFFNKIDQKDTGKTKSIWFPPQENMDTESKRYE